MQTPVLDDIQIETMGKSDADLGVELDLFPDLDSRFESLMKPSKVRKLTTALVLIQSLC